MLTVQVNNQEECRSPLLTPKAVTNSEEDTSPLLLSPVSRSSKNISAGYSTIHDRETQCTDEFNMMPHPHFEFSSFVLWGMDINVISFVHFQCNLYDVVYKGEVLGIFIPLSDRYKWDDIVEAELTHQLDRKFAGTQEAMAIYIPRSMFVNPHCNFTEVVGGGVWKIIPQARVVELNHPNIDIPSMRRVMLQFVHMGMTGHRNDHIYLDTKGKVHLCDGTDSFARSTSDLQFKWIAISRIANRPFTEEERDYIESINTLTDMDTVGKRLNSYSAMTVHAICTTALKAAIRTSHLTLADVAMWLTISSAPSRIFKSCVDNDLWVDLVQLEHRTLDHMTDWTGFDTS